MLDYTQEQIVTLILDAISDTRAKMQTAMIENDYKVFRQEEETLKYMYLCLDIETKKLVA